MRLKALAAESRPEPTRLYLVRHGQVAQGHTHRYHGHNDIELSPQGERQLEELAAQLRPLPLAAVYASDLTRTLKGAQSICRGRDLTPQAVAEFREIHFGAWEGLSFEEIAARYPGELQARFQDLANFRIPGGESLMDVRRRALPRLKKIIEVKATLKKYGISPLEVFEPSDFGTLGKEIGKVSTSKGVPGAKPINPLK